MLIPCPECHASVSEQAVACPHCGYPLTPGRRQPRVIPLQPTARLSDIPWYVIMAVCLVVVFLGCYHSPLMRGTRDTFTRDVIVWAGLILVISCSTALLAAWPVRGFFRAAGGIRPSYASTYMHVAAAIGTTLAVMVGPALWLITIMPKSMTTIAGIAMLPLPIVLPWIYYWFVCNANIAGRAAASGITAGVTYVFLGLLWSYGFTHPAT
jgi:hypothetical protein